MQYNGSNGFVPLITTPFYSIGYVPKRGIKDYFLNGFDPERESERTAKALKILLRYDWSNPETVRTSLPFIDIHMESIGCRTVLGPPISGFVLPVSPIVAPTYSAQPATVQQMQQSTPTPQLQTVQTPSTTQQTNHI